MNSADTLKAQFERMYDDTTLLSIEYEYGKILFPELQKALQKTYVEYDGTWWAVGCDSRRFYRYNKQAEVWERAIPPVELRDDIDTSIDSPSQMFIPIKWKI
jgi:hypothetical protein